MARLYKLVFKPNLLGTCVPKSVNSHHSRQIRLVILGSEVKDQDNFGKEQKEPTGTQPFSYQKLYGRS